MKPLSVWQIQVLRYVVKNEPTGELFKWFYQRTIFSLIERKLITVHRGSLRATSDGWSVVEMYTSASPKKKKVAGLSRRVERAVVGRRKVG